MKQNNIRVIAITTTLYVAATPILELMKFIRENNSTAKVVIGGPYISNLFRSTDPLSLQHVLKYLNADVYVISSEGEAALVGIIEALKTKSRLDKVENIAYKEGGKFVLTQASAESNSLPDNMVNYKLFPKEEFEEFVTLRTAKSCLSVAHSALFLPVPGGMHT